MKKEYILVLPSWYPSKLDEFNGDFNERLVHAVSQYKAQIVVYVSTKKESKLDEIEVSEKGNILTYKAFFIYSKYDLVNVLRMFKLYLKIFKIIFKKFGLPVLVHNYVFFPSGIASIYLKYRYKLKIVLTEHWSLFNYKNNKNHIYTHSQYKKFLYSFILKSFDTVIAVSESLGLSISEWTSKSKRYVLPNVVDVEIFNRNMIDKPVGHIFTYIHVSNIGPHKNVEQILEVFNKVLESNVQANLTIVGNENETVMSMINNNSLLKHRVNFNGEISYKEVAENMKKADAFILFSKYENMPCVILEALCCGLPVISSNVGGIANVISKQNGILVESENKVELGEAMLNLMNNYQHYDNDKISAEAIASYNYNNIGKRTNDIYRETLK